jgi:hypothetical protein
LSPFTSTTTNYLNIVLWQIPSTTTHGTRIAQKWKAKGIAPEIAQRREQAGIKP